jgi:hypothetical protein
MFQNCCSLNLLVAANFAASVSGLNAENMFYSCQQLSSIDLSSAKITKLGARGPNATAMGALETLLVHPSSTFGGTLPQLDIRYNTLTAGQLDAIFTALPTVASKTVDITGCPGANTCDKLIATSKGWLVTG